MLKSCGTNEGTEGTTVTEIVDTSVETNYDEDDFFEEEDGDNAQETIKEQADDLDYTEIDKVVEDISDNKDISSPDVVDVPFTTKPTNTSSKRITTGTNTGKFMVISRKLSH